MKKKALILIIFAAFLSGCSGAVVVNDKVMGVQSGRFIYQDGYLTTQYKADIDPVWRACEKAMLDLKASDIRKDRNISSGTIKAVIADEKVKILVAYVDRDLTTVSVLSGVVNNNMASRMIQDRIAANLGSP